MGTQWAQKRDTASFLSFARCCWTVFLEKIVTFSHETGLQKTLKSNETREFWMILILQIYRDQELLSVHHDSAINHCIKEHFTQKIWKFCHLQTHVYRAQFNVNNIKVDSCVSCDFMTPTPVSLDVIYV